jgi:hypothetical protein
LTGFFFFTTRGGACGAAERDAAGRDELFPADFGGREVSDIGNLPETMSWEVRGAADRRGARPVGMKFYPAIWLEIKRIPVKW